MKTLMALILAFSLTSAFANTPKNKVTTGSAATTGSQTGTFASEAAPVNDTVGTGQAATVRRERAATDCVDRDGQVFAKGDVGYTSCRAHMRAK